MDSAKSVDERAYGGARLAAPLAAIVVLAGLDLALTNVTLLGWLALPPLLASLMVTPRGTALVSAVALAMAVLLGIPDHIVGQSEHLVRLGVVVGAGLLAVATAWMRVEKDLAFATAQEASALRAAVLHSALDCVICMDWTGRIVEFNHAAQRTFGYPREEAIGRELAQLIVPPELREAYREALQRFVESGDSSALGRRSELVAMRADGSRVPVELTMNSVESPDGPLITGFLRDITEQKRVQEELRRQALHDPLTGLPNRSLFMDRLELALRRRSRSPGRTAVFFIDFDRFKQVNDTYGHAAGDRLLVTAARRWSDAIRPGDTLGRISGDEFTLVCEGLAGEDQVAAIAERLLEALAPPIDANGYPLEAKATIGVVIAPDEGASAEWLLSVADGAMYQAKGRGGGRYSLLDGSAARWQTGQARPETRVT
jgi:diguanylate cyclase (GGDEF)-like protein/PAS domain S-box-containing protein